MSGRVVDLRAVEKAWHTLRAQFCLRGYALDRRCDGGYRVSLGTWSIDLPDMGAVLDFGARAGVAIE